MAQVSQQRGTCAAVFPPCLHAHPSCPPSRLCPARPCRAPPSLQRVRPPDRKGGAQRDVENAARAAGGAAVPP